MAGMIGYGMVLCSHGREETMRIRPGREQAATGTARNRTKKGDLLRRITADPRVLGGKPIIRETRISVEFVLELLASGATEEEILLDYPHLKPADVRACLEYAAF
jgi:uncharacterized protein (DUF433 family)